jgi:negative regulator of sigma-B (phosphoserine phosphatase)
MDGCIEWATAARAFDDRLENGDQSYTVNEADWAFAAVIDGLGHGPEAEHAALSVVAAITQSLPPTLPDLFTLSHAAAKKTRGVAMTALRYDRATKMITWLGVGNVEAVCLRKSGKTERLNSHSGVVGYRMPHTLREYSFTLEAGDWVAMATDGVKAALLAPSFFSSAEELANELLARGLKGTDDALVWAGRPREVA